MTSLWLSYIQTDRVDRHFPRQPRLGSVAYKSVILSVHLVCNCVLVSSWDKPTLTAVYQTTTPHTWYLCVTIVLSTSLVTVHKSDDVGDGHRCRLFHVCAERATLCKIFDDGSWCKEFLVQNVYLSKILCSSGQNVCDLKTISDFCNSENP